MLKLGCVLSAVLHSRSDYRQPVALQDEQLLQTMMDSFKHPNLHSDPPALEDGLVQDPSDVPQVGRRGVHEWVFVN